MAKHKKEKKSKKDRKEKKRRHRSSSPSSSGSDSDEEYKRRKAEKLAKKVAQHLKKHKVTGTGYSNEDNPFGDTNLTERFVWGKKIEKEIAGGRDVRDMTAKAEMKRQAERLEEIEKVKKRREQREAEKAAMAEELEMIQRERAIAEAADLEKKEEEFHLEQAKAKSQQRLGEGRPKPIDRLAHTIFLMEGADPQEEPTSLISGLSLRQLKDLRDDVANFQEMDKHHPLHREFWSAALLVAEHELYEQQKQEDLDRAKLRGEPVPAKYAVREAGWHESIDTEVQVMLAGKTHRELLELEGGIQAQLDSGTAADPEYWQAVLKRLALHKAKARLREIHADMMQQHLAKMMADVDVPGAMGWGAEDQAGEEDEEQIEEEEEGRPPLSAEEQAAAAAAAADDNEIELAEDEEEGGEGGAAGGAAAAAAAGEGGAPVDAELEALARAPGPTDAAKAAKDAEKEAAAAASAVERAAAARQKETARGEPRNWDDMSDGEQEGHADELGSYSPAPLPPTAYAGQDVIPEEEDLRLLELTRAQVKYKEVQRYKAASAAAAAARPAQAEADRIYRRIMQRPGDAARMLGGGAPMTRFLSAPAQGSEQPSGEADAGEVAFRRTADKLMGDLGTSGDAPFGGEVQVDADSQVYWWHEKYRPRRPKYFNRVHTGYEWNKYNQTHYDGDNPPPKTVQGYKFNIFYPELLDKTVAPTYKIDRDPTSPDGSTCILRFTAGPPYEDIAFRIINHEWEYNHKRGFKCVFERGILHLYFNFRRERYRR